MRDISSPACKLFVQSYMNISQLWGWEIKLHSLFFSFASVEAKLALCVCNSVYASAIYWEKAKYWKERKHIQQGWRPTVWWRLMAFSYDFMLIKILPWVRWQNSTPFLCKEVLWDMKIQGFKADGQDILEEKTKQHEEDV
jgi:hypothetical protein